MEMATKIDIADKEFVEELIYILLTKKDTSHEEELIATLRKANEIKFFDIAYPTTDSDNLIIKSIITTIINKRIQGEPLSVIREELLNSPTVSNRLKYILDKYKNKAISENMYYYIRLLKNKIKLLSLYKFLIDMYDISSQAFRSVGNPDENLQALLSKVNTLYMDINFDNITQEIDFSNPEDTEKRFNEYIDMIVDEEKHKPIKTGIKLLDAVFDIKGLRRKNLYMISAPYGIGKTRFVIYMGANIFKQGFNVYHITIENDKTEVSFLYDLHFLGLSYDEFRAFVKNQGREKAKELINTIKGVMNAYKQEYGNVLEIKKFSPYKVSARDIELYINRKMEAGYPKPDVLIVDHIDILMPNKGNAKDLFERLELITSELKDLAERYNIAVIVPSQLNREGAKSSKGGLSIGGGEMVSRSMAKNELTSFHMTLLQSPEESVYDYMRIYIDKNRFGLQRCIFPIVFDKAKIQVEDVITDEDFAKYEAIVFPEKDTEDSKIRNSKDYREKERILSIIKMWIDTLKERADDNFEQFLDKYKEIKKNYLEYLKEVNIESEKTNTTTEDKTHDVDDMEETDIEEDDITEAIDLDKPVHTKSVPSSVVQHENETEVKSNSEIDVAVLELEKAEEEKKIETYQEPNNTGKLNATMYINTTDIGNDISSNTKKQNGINKVNHSLSFNEVKFLTFEHLKNVTGRKDFSEKDYLKYILTFN